MSSYFITATGTDIGKTFVTVGIIRAAREAGRRFGAIKPVISGYTAQNAAESDPARLLTAMGKTPTQDNIAAISPWRYAAALSPDLAAAREGRSIDFNALTGFCEAAMSASPEGLLIEGVGGVAVPVNPRRIVADWIATLRIPTILVAGTYLGTISHTITAAETLAARGIAITAIVLNESANAPISPGETAAVLARFLPIPIHNIPRDADMNGKAFRVLAMSL
jgi:dethiobiotin synthetase